MRKVRNWNDCRRKNHYSDNNICPDCGVRIVNKAIRCKSCSRKIVVAKLTTLGEWPKKKRTVKIKKCDICGKKLSTTSWYRKTTLYCHSCAMKIRMTKSEDFYKKNIVNLQKIADSRKGKHRSQHVKLKISEGVKKAWTIHHVDGNHKNNQKDNITKLKMRTHSYLHQYAYKFLAKDSKLLLQYIDWLEKNKNVGLTTLKNIIHEKL
jgi:DNA-directed RNA polymerase subunit RPC12/RpoP